MTHLKNFYEVRPNELEPGDVLVCTVTLHVSHFLQEDGKPFFKMYWTGFPPETFDGAGVPQGTRISFARKEENAVARALFPVVVAAGLRSGG